jgi:hypothetical protein
MVPQALKDIPHWLVWRFVQKDPTKKPAKMPFYSNGRVRGKTKEAAAQVEQGSAEDLELLVSFDMAMTAMSRGRFDGVGFAFLPGDGLIGIDIDGAINLETGEISERARQIVAACDSFTELSPSGKGLHIYVRGQTETFKSDDIGVEVFCGSQFFTVTGEHYAGTPETVNAITPEALDMLRVMVREAKELKREANRMQREYQLQQERERAGSGAGGQVPPPAAGAPASSAGRPVSRSPSGENDFARVNAAAMANFDAWVPVLFPGALRAGQGYRVPSKSLGRDLQEDIGIHREGIVDFGVADQGDANDGRRSPIDLVMEWGHKDLKAALHWLAGQLGVAIAAAGSGAAAGKRAKIFPKGRGVADADSMDDYPPADGLPEIRWRAGFLPEIVDEAEKALLARSSDRIYQRSGTLVRIVRRERHSNRSYRRPPNVLGLMMVEPAYLTELFTRSAVWKKFDARHQDWKRINAPEQVTMTYLSRAYNWKVPPLWSTITAPTLRPDGTLLQKPGYDAAMRTFYDPGDIVFPHVPDAPTKSEATAALDVLLNAISTFPFQEEVDRSVAVAMMLTGLVRRALPSAPLGAITAPSPESGKTLLADVIATLAMGPGAPAMKFADTDEEAAKIALSVLMEGDPVVVIDNVERPLQGDWLCTMLTSETYKSRVLGRSEMINVPTNCLWLATGNHIVIQGDLRNRTLLVRLDAKMERPGERVFRDDLRVWMMDHRPELVAAGLTVLRAFQVAKEDPRKYCPQWGRFEQWSDMVRAPLCWLGLDDPHKSMEALEAEDPMRQEHLAVLATWHEEFGSEQLTARGLIERITGEAVFGEAASRLRELLGEFSKDRQGGFNARRLSSWLRRHAGRRVSGYQLVKVGERDHTGIWCVERVSESEVHTA